ncbi:MAG: hypothetical protein ACP5O5_07150, partial [Fervidicoccaceae archaeon]
AVNHPKLKYRLQLDEPLWHLSRFGCKSRNGNFCPKKIVCPVNQFCVGGTVHVPPTKIKIDT